MIFNDTKLLYKSYYNHHIFFLQFEVKGTGWVSLALTERGSLMGSDIIIGWVAADQSATIIVSCFSNHLTMLDAQN